MGDLLRLCNVDMIVFVHIAIQLVIACGKDAVNAVKGILGGAEISLGHKVPDIAGVEDEEVVFCRIVDGIVEILHAAAFVFMIEIPFAPMVVTLVIVVEMGVRQMQDFEG